MQGSSHSKLGAIKEKDISEEKVSKWEERRKEYQKAETQEDEEEEQEKEEDLHCFTGQRRQYCPGYVICPLTRSGEHQTAAKTPLLFLSEYEGKGNAAWVRF